MPVLWIRIRFNADSDLVLNPDPGIWWSEIVILYRSESKIAIIYLWAFMMDVQATEASNPQMRTSSTSRQPKFLHFNFFTFLWVIFGPPGSGSTLIHFVNEFPDWDLAGIMVSIVGPHWFQFESWLSSESRSGWSEIVIFYKSKSKIAIIYLWAFMIDVQATEASNPQMRTSCTSRQPKFLHFNFFTFLWVIFGPPWFGSMPIHFVNEFPDWDLADQN